MITPSDLDQKLIPGTLGLGLYDRQGVLSTFTALATTLIGVLAGHWLGSGRASIHKTLGFVAAGVVMLLALFYWIIDVKGYKKWTFFLVVIGMNAITIWVGQRLIDFEYTSDALLLGCSKYLGAAAPLLLTFGVLLIKWLFLWFLYNR